MNKDISLKRKLRYLMLIPVFIFTITACENSEDNAFTDWPIIEAYLTPGCPIQVKLSRQLPFSSEVTYSDDDINNLEIIVYDAQDSVTLTPIGNGQYVDSTFVLQEGSMINIRFSFNQKNVSAYSYIPVKPSGFTQSATSISISQMGSSSGQPTSPPTMPEPIELNWTNDDASYYLLVIENIEEEPEAVFEFEDDEERPAPRFRKQPSTASGVRLNAMEFQYYGMHRIILCHVLPDYATLYESTSSSSQNLTNPSTSIINGYGIFTGLNTDTLFVEVVKASS